MSKRKIPFFLLIVILFLLLVPLQARINRLRVEKDLVETNIFEATTPSDVWGTLLLAGFRGIAVDILWIRAMNLQQEGKFFELVSLYKLILDLQPHFLQVWAYSAWNMAYNISHDCETLQEKWTWIQKGISLLEKGIKRNSKDWRLYFELGWIYFHKCEAEPYYYQQLKKEGKNNLEIAISWFRETAKKEYHPSYVERMMAHGYEKLANRAEEEGQLAERDLYQEKALAQWKDNMEKYPQDNISREAYHHWKKKISERKD